MHRLLRLLALVVLAMEAPSALAAEGAAPVESLYIVEFTTGPAWVAEKPFSQQAHAADHSANLGRLRGQGTLVLGARHGAKGMIVLRSPSEAAARAEIDEDPAVRAGVFSYTIEPFKPFYGGCIETGSPAPPSPGP